MTRKLSELDRIAVDLLFDRLHGANGGGNGQTDSVVILTGNVSEDRMSAVQRILNLLDAAPAPEPPADLAVRTLQRVARHADSSIHPGAAGLVDPTQPTA